MKRMWKSVALALALLFTGASFAQETPVLDKREKRQQKRIKQGVKSGELTPKETAKLEGRGGRGGILELSERGIQDQVSFLRDERRAARDPELRLRPERLQPPRGELPAEPDDLYRDRNGAEALHALRRIADDHEPRARL